MVTRVLALLFPLADRRAAKTRADARLDLYEHGMTVAVNGRVHVVRYDSTCVFLESAAQPGDLAAAPVRTVTDVGGQQVGLCGRTRRGVPGIASCGGGFRDAEEWGARIQRAVIEAQLPRALAALGKGERLAFGEIWLTRQEIGSGEVSARWPLVQRLEIHDGSVGLSAAGNWHSLGTVASEVPNLFVLRALVELLRTNASHRGSAAP